MDDTDKQVFDSVQDQKLSTRNFEAHVFSVEVWNPHQKRWEQAWRCVRTVPFRVRVSKGVVVSEGEPVK